MTEFEKNTRKRLRKSERLSGHRQIQTLFSAGKSFTHYPFLVRYQPLAEGDQSKYHQVLISVSKRNFKRATDRNRIKRQIREAYRLNKHLLDQLPEKMAIAYIYIAKDKIPYNLLEEKLIGCFSRLKTELATPNEN